jgi:hypothetical protein
MNNMEGDVNEIYANAVDSQRIGMEHFLKERGYSSRKHAILTLFHAIELFLKEQLYRNPILIYRNLDAKITEDSQTVGIKEALTRLENLGLGLPNHPREAIERLQKRRNRIEHHRYDQKDEDESVISEALTFIMFFVEGVLGVKLEDDVPPEILRAIQGLVFDRQDRDWIARYRLELWEQKTWPEWNVEVEDSPAAFEGTDNCPMCRQDYLIIGHHQQPFCFYCNTSIDAVSCEDCGRTRLNGSLPPRVVPLKSRDFPKRGGFHAEVEIQ